MNSSEIALNARLLVPGSRVLVALSGGVDSLALLHRLVAGRSGLPIELLAAHVHHGMRGDAADADVEFLRRTCAEWEVPLVVIHRDVPALAAERGVGVEEAGRIARYEAFAEVAREYGCGQVVTAHHADDQVETLLLHLLRGTGLDGLRGMPERRSLSAAPGAPELIRPLLGVWRHELEGYCREQGLHPRHDSTNDDPRYRRNRIRRELLPLLDSLAPAARQSLLRLTRHAVEEVEVLDTLAQELLARARVPDVRQVAATRAPAWLIENRLPFRSALEVSVLSAAPSATVRRALRLWIREAADRPAELSLELLDRLLCLASEDGDGSEGAVDLPVCGLRVRRRGVQFRIEHQQAEAPPPSSVTIPAPGSYHLTEFGLILTIVEAAPPGDPRLPAEQACLDFNSVSWPLCVRPPHPGDRFRPLGAPGSRLLSDLFIDRKIPVEARASWPLLEDGSGILWVCGLAVADRARVAAGTRRVLHLRIAPLPAEIDLSPGCG